MSNQQATEELNSLRQEIDRLDDEILDLLAQRFEVTARVGKLKASAGLESVDPAREQEKLERLRAQAESSSLNSEFILALFQTIFDEVVRNHRSYLENSGG